MNATSRVLALAVTLLLVLGATSAQAEPTKQECVDAYTNNQRLRREGALRAAIKQLLVCARDPCPPVLQSECIEWLKDANARLPSVVIKAHAGAGSDLTDVTVRLDGTPLVAQLDGRAIDVDAGLHTFVFEHAGAAPVERKLLIVEGEKNRIIDVDFSSKALPPPPPSEPTEARRPVSWTTIALGGLGVAAVGIGATFGTVGLAGRSDLATCTGSHCYDDRDSVARKFLAADVAFAAGAVAILAATVLYVTRPAAQRPEAR